MKTNKFSFIKVLVGIGVVLIGFSCSQEKRMDYTSEGIILEETGETSLLNTYEAEEEEDIEQSEKGRNTIDDNIKIIKNANCRIKVKNVEEATRLAKNLALRYQGYISDERFTNTNYAMENRFTIRVPKNQFDKVLDSICAFAEFVDHKNISTIDVTEEYIDITSRLKTKFEVKQRYETILRAKAKTVEDVLKTEEKLSKLQEEIESAQGRLKYISNKVSYSTIQVDMYQTIIPKEEPEMYEPHFLDKAKNGLSFGWGIIENLTLALFYIWPLLLLAVIVFVYFKWIRK